MAHEQVLTALERARAASEQLKATSSTTRDAALRHVADAVVGATGELIEANGQDIRSGRDAGMSPGAVDRLRLTEDRLAAVADGLRRIARQPDPTGVVQAAAGGRQLRVPLGVVGMVHEAQPAVVPEAAGVLLKAGNVGVFRGDHAAAHSDAAMVEVLRTALSEVGLPADVIQLLAGRERSIRRYLVSSTGLLDLVLVRGGDRLAGLVQADASVPTVVLGSGSCHVYIDASAQVSRAVRVVLESKTAAPTLPHAVHTVLVHADIADTALPPLVRALNEEGIAVHADPLLPGAVPINEEDWISEYLGRDIAVKVVDSLEKAVEHIARYGAGHTEVVVTEDEHAARAFLDRVDAAIVKVNVATTPEETAGNLVCTQKVQFRGPLWPASLTSTVTQSWSAADSHGPGCRGVDHTCTG